MTVIDSTIQSKAPLAVAGLRPSHTQRPQGLGDSCVLGQETRAQRERMCRVRRPKHNESECAGSGDPSTTGWRPKHNRVHNREAQRGKNQETCEQQSFLTGSPSSSTGDKRRHANADANARSVTIGEVFREWGKSRRGRSATRCALTTFSVCSSLDVLTGIVRDLNTAALWEFREAEEILRSVWTIDVVVLCRL